MFLEHRLPGSAALIGWLLRHGKKRAAEAAPRFTPKGVLTTLILGYQGCLISATLCTNLGAVVVRVELTWIEDRPRRAWHWEEQIVCRNR